MKAEKLSKIKTAEQARQIAIDWEEWTSNKSLCSGELVIWQDYFMEIGEKFGLLEEFKENGII